MFRPSQVFRNTAVLVEHEGRELIRKKAMIYTPGEMALVTLSPELLQGLEGGTITVRMERKE